MNENEGAPHLAVEMWAFAAPQPPKAAGAGCLQKFRYPLSSPIPSAAKTAHITLAVRTSNVKNRAINVANAHR